MSTVDSLFHIDQLREQTAAERPVYLYDHVPVDAVHQRNLNALAALGYRVRFMEPDTNQQFKNWVYVLLERT